MIAIDGPAASGKGTIAAGVARALGFHLLDSGSLYRLVALKALRTGHRRSTTSAALAAAAARSTSNSPTGGCCSTGRRHDAIRGEDVGAAASRVAVHAGRAHRADRRGSRHSGAPRGWSPTGGTWAPSCSRTRALKVFVTASPEERARRRHKQLIEKGISVKLKVFCATSGARRARRRPGGCTAQAGRRCRDPGYDANDDRRRRRLRARALPRCGTAAFGDKRSEDRTRVRLSRVAGGPVQGPVACSSRRSAADSPTSPPRETKGSRPRRRH